MTVLKLITPIMDKLSNQKQTLKDKVQETLLNKKVSKQLKNEIEDKLIKYINNECNIELLSKIYNYLIKNKGLGLEQCLLDDIKIVDLLDVIKIHRYGFLFNSITDTSYALIKVIKQKSINSLQILITKNEKNEDFLGKFKKYLKNELNIQFKNQNMNILLNMIKNYNGDNYINQLIQANKNNLIKYIERKEKELKHKKNEIKNLLNEVELLIIKLYNFNRFDEEIVIKRYITLIKNKLNKMINEYIDIFMDSDKKMMVRFIQQLNEMLIYYGKYQDIKDNLSVWNQYIQPKEITELLEAIDDDYNEIKNNNFNTVMKDNKLNSLELLFKEIAQTLDINTYILFMNQSRPLVKKYINQIIKS